MGSTLQEEKGTSSRKRRLSKKERRALKKKKKDKPKISETPHDKSKAENDHIPQDNDVNDEDYLNSYEPLPVPATPSHELWVNNKGSKVVNSDDVVEGGGGKNTLGKWFPNALLIKTTVSYTNTGQLLLNGLNPKAAAAASVRVPNPRASLVLFYQYTRHKKWSPTTLKLLMTYLSTIANKRNIGGRIRVAQEGVNATVSAVDTQRVSAKETLRHFAQDLRNFDSQVFSNTDFKYIDDLTADRHFKELKVIPVQELVFYGIKEDDAPLDDEKGKDGTGGGVHLEAKKYHEMLKGDNTVVIDVRNHYETIIGRFDGQQKVKGKTFASKDAQQTTSQADSVTTMSGAEYLDPLMRKSTDFKAWLAKDETQQKLKHKTVLMYCTGGIRCERASAYLKKEMGSQVEGVYQLQGGIERYLKAFPDGGFWRGKNFVFDKREAVGVENPDGDGGVIRKQTKKLASTKKEDLNSLPSRCCVCGIDWDRYVGKKKCFTCGVPVLMCNKCLSQKPDKTPGMELNVRCPLCVRENITVPASEVELTANGTRGINNSKETKVAASSVLKWGGGHAARKKLNRKSKGRLCRFGSECIRKDCIFLHPGLDNAKCQGTTK